MSRVHDALRRAEQLAVKQADPVPSTGSLVLPRGAVPPGGDEPATVAARGGSVSLPRISLSILDQVEEVPFNPAAESHLINLDHPQVTPSEEFRALRTKLNHLQTLQPIHNILVTSPAPAEGKSFTAANLALAQAHLAENLTLLADLDLRRPVMHQLFQINQAPGFSDYLLGNASLGQVLKRVAGTNLYLMPAGSPVKNPLELLNLRDVKTLFEQLPQIFNWAIFDTPPILFSADANLLSTLADGTVLVVRIGATTIDSVTRAMQALCNNNVLGVVANGARAGELYYKYTYYYNRQD
ncbi:MAG: CpsD/CapB family tyrosine-protein kinase [Bryobacteraceae bacterium]